MAKVQLNPVFEQLRGGIGDLVFKRYRGGVIVARKADPSSLVPSQAQLDQRERFRQAALYGKMALADAQTRLLYEQAAEAKDLPVFALTVADYFHAPVIDEIDLEAYIGNVGDEIVVHAHDDVMVQQVLVRLTDAADNVLETGLAVEDPADSGRWVYPALTQVAPGETVFVTATVSDLPGGTTVETIEKLVESPIAPTPG